MSAGRSFDPSPDPPSHERGRPRRGDVDKLVCDGALRLAATTGYAGATIDHIAATSGVSKSTIYRRWRSKELLYVDVAERQLGRLPDSPGMSTEEVVREGVEWLVHRLMRPGMGAALAGVFAQAATDTELRHEAVSRLRDPHVNLIADRLGAPRERLELIVDLVVGATLHHYGITGREYSPAEADRLVRIITRTVLDGL